MDPQNTIPQVPPVSLVPPVPPLEPAGQPVQTPPLSVQVPPPENKTSLLVKYALFVFLFFVVAAGIYIVWVKVIPKMGQKACTMEAKVCPDGTSVGRVAPSCDFAPCPSSILTADKTVTITTDKTEYEQGEEINVRLSYQDTIYAWDEYAWSIQMWENDSWITIRRRGDPYLFCSNISECEDVDLSKIEECPSLVLCEEPCWYQVQSTPKLTWHQTYKVYEKTFQCKFIQRLPNGRVTSEEVVSRTCAVFEQVPPGKYRIRFEYTLASDPNNQCSRDIDIKYAESEIIVKGKEGENPRTKCLGSCKCMKECNKGGPLYFIPVEEGSPECSINSVDKTCCCSGV